MGFLEHSIWTGLCEVSFTTWQRWSTSNLTSKSWAYFHVDFLIMYVKSECWFLQMYILVHRYFKYFVSLKHLLTLPFLSEPFYWKQCLYCVMICGVIPFRSFVIVGREVLNFHQILLYTVSCIFHCCLTCVMLAHFPLKFVLL